MQIENMKPITEVTLVQRRERVVQPVQAVSAPGCAMCGGETQPGMFGQVKCTRCGFTACESCGG